jgi:predicted metalloprotease with PDZ domain
MSFQVKHYQSKVIIRTLCLMLGMSALNAAMAQEMSVQVDATDSTHRVMRMKAQMAAPSEGKPLVLQFPQWIPGHHGPTALVQNITGVNVSVNGKRVPWVRDTTDMFTFRAEMPAGAKQVEVEYQYLNAFSDDQGDKNVSSDIVGIVWDTLLLYPKLAEGKTAKDLSVQATVKYPAGFSHASALDVASTGADNTVKYKPVSLETLQDSPAYAGRYYKRVTLEEGAQPAYLNIFADKASELEAKPEYIEAHKKLVQQATTLYASRHYRRYEFMLVISEKISGKGLEHHESSENTVKLGYFAEWDKSWPGRDLLAHEMTHSWNGKFRRPADLSTPHFNTPMRNTLLWVYEGQTQYWGWVLAARSGLLSQEQARDQLASTAAYLSARKGRAWRNLQDTTNSGIIGVRRRESVFGDWQRGYDYYDEMLLNWLDADTRIRTESNSAKSLDNFAASFFGVKNGSVEVLPYTFDELTQTLNATQAFDWATHLRNKLDTNDGANLLEGIERSGWKLVYGDKPNTFIDAAQTKWGEENWFAHNIGANISKDGKFISISWDGPSFKAGIPLESTLVAVNGTAYKASELTDAIKQAQKDKKPMELLIKQGDRYRTVALPYYDGLHIPKLERVEGKPDLLTAILTARS